MSHRPSWRAISAGLIVVVCLALGTSAASAAPGGKKPPPSTGDSAPPTTPTELRVTDTTRTSITLAWNASTDNSGIFSYVVKQDNLSWTVSSQSQTSYTLTWLSPGRTYTF